MGRLNIFFVVVLTGIVLGCSSSDDSPQNITSTFKLDNSDYTVNLANLKIVNTGEGISRASIIITGSNGSKVGAVTFLLTFSTTEGIVGTYGADPGIGSLGTYVPHLSTYSVQNGSVLEGGNYPQGEFKITSHGSKQYTVDFQVLYEDEVRASGVVRRDFTDN